MAGPPSKNRSVMIEGTPGGEPVEIEAPAGVPVEVGAIEVIGSAEATARATGVDIFLADLVVPSDGVLLIGLSADTGHSMNLDIVRGVTTMPGDLNAGGTLGADEWFFFTLPVQENDEVNFQATFGGGGNIIVNMTVAIERV